MKFTEEQYQKIVEIAKRWRNNRAQRTKSCLNYVFDNYLTDTDNENKLDIALAIANPLTREWAHEKFVEKEKKYYWNLKDNLAFGLASDGLIVNIGLNQQSKLTESIIKAWGYNPEMFDKEEV